LGETGTEGVILGELWGSWADSPAAAGQQPPPYAVLWDERGAELVAVCSHVDGGMAWLRVEGLQSVGTWGWVKQPTLA